MILRCTMAPFQERFPPFFWSDLLFLGPFTGKAALTPTEANSWLKHVKLNLNESFKHNLLNKMKISTRTTLHVSLLYKAFEPPYLNIQVCKFVFILFSFPREALKRKPFCCLVNYLFVVSGPPHSTHKGITFRQMSTNAENGTGCLFAFTHKFTALPSSPPGPPPTSPIALTITRLRSK